jgi:hypothetical protein
MKVSKLSILKRIKLGYNYMDKNTFGAIVAVGLLEEGFFDKAKTGWKNLKTEMNKDSDKKSSGAAGAVGTGLGKVYNFARKVTAPGIGGGLQYAGEQIAKTGGKIGVGFANKAVGLGRKTYDAGYYLKNKYKKS